MTWVRIDEGFPEHPKVLAVGPIAAWLHVCALAYCNRQLTNGSITTAVLARLSDGSKHNKALAQRLVDAGLWEIDGDAWLIHDFLDYQPSRQTVEMLRAKRADAGRQGGVMSGHTRRSKHEANDEASASPIEANASALLEANTKPVPSRSVPFPLVTSSVTSSSGGEADDDDFMKAIKIVVEHKARQAPPRNRRAWELTTIPRTIAEDGKVIHAELDAGHTPTHAAGVALGSQRKAELAAGRLA